METARRLLESMNSTSTTNRRKCLICGELEDPAYGGWCQCGAANWIAAMQPPQPRLVQQVRAALVQPSQLALVPKASESGLIRALPRILARVDPEPDLDEHGLMRATHIVDAIVDDYEGSTVNELLGGVMRGALLLIAGSAGHGKSTCSAGLAARAAMWWARADDRRYSFEEAIALVPKRARVLVIDSLERWGGSSPKAQMAVMTAVREHDAMVKIVIAGTNKDGAVYGISEIERADDATILATKDGDHYSLSCTKQRWSPCAAALVRRRDRLGIEEEDQREEQAPEVASSPPPALPPAAPQPQAAPKPNFSPAFLAKAAHWSVIKAAEYRCDLRALGVPEPSVQDWSNAVIVRRRQLQKKLEEVEEETAEAEEPDEPEEDEDEEDES